MKKIVIKQNKTYTIEDLCLIAQNKALIAIEKNVLNNVDKNFQQVKKLSDKQNTYGLTTGVGDLCVEKPTVSTDTFQKNILLSHACGVGKPLPKWIVRGTIFSRLITLSQGASGVSKELLFFLAELLNKDAIPFVSSRGSIGASDLVILAETFVMLCNEGKVLYKGEIYTPFDAFKKAKISFPKKLQTREGLALINGNNATIAQAAFLIEQLSEYIEKSLLVAALSIEARTATSSVYTGYNEYFSEQKCVAQKLKKIFEKSTQVAKSYENTTQQFLQDPPAFKTIPQIFGAALETLERTKKVVENEFNTITDNPLLYSTTSGIERISSGNYLCVALAQALYELSISIRSIAETSVARMQILTNSQYNEGLPQYLIQDIANNSGFMIPIYTAQSLLAEIQALSYPRSNFSISVANGWESVSTNAYNASLNVKNILDFAYDITTIELLLATQAVAFRLAKKQTRLGEKTVELFFQTKNALQKKNILLPIQKDMYLKELIEICANELFSERNMYE